MLDKLVFSHRLVSGYFKIAWVEPSTRISAYGLKIAVRIANFFTALRIETAISVSPVRTRVCFEVPVYYYGVGTNLKFQVYASTFWNSLSVISTLWSCLYWTVITI